MQHGHTLRDGQPQAADAAAAALDGRVTQRQAQVQPLVQFARQTGPAVFDHDLGLRAFAPQAHTHRMAAGSVTHGVVDQVRQGTLDQLQVAVEFQAARRYAMQHDRGLHIAEFELLHRIRHHFVQAEAFAVQHLFGGLQRGQFEQLLRKPADFAALRQRRLQHGRAAFSVGCGLARQGLQVAVQRRQRRAQVVRHAGHHLAVVGHLALLAPGLRLDAVRHVGEGLGKGLHLVAHRKRRRACCQALGRFCPGATPAV